jgi:hypothetical protein
MIRKEEQEISENTLVTQPLGSNRKSGRPRLRWRDEVNKGARMFGIRNW